MKDLQRLLIPILLLTVTGCFRPVLRDQPTLEQDLTRLRRNLESLPAVEPEQQQTGSIWNDAGPGMALMRDTRAFRANDLVTVVLQETASGTNQSATDLSRESDHSFGASTAFGLEKANPQAGRFSLNNVLTSSTSSDFQADGATSRSTSLNASITARVMKVLPNGDLLIAGQKNVMVNRDQQVLTMVGTVRPVDVNANNMVGSSSVGELTVRLWGKGEVDETTRQGWFIRVLNHIWPF